MQIDVNDYANDARRAERGVWGGGGGNSLPLSHSTSGLDKVSASRGSFPSKPHLQVERIFSG